MALGRAASGGSGPTCLRQPAYSQLASALDMCNTHSRQAPKASHPKLFYQLRGGQPFGAWQAPPHGRPATSHPTQVLMVMHSVAQ